MFLTKFQYNTNYGIDMRNFKSLLNQALYQLFIEQLNFFPYFT